MRLSDISNGFSGFRDFFFKTDLLIWSEDNETVEAIAQEPLNEETRKKVGKYEVFFHAENPQLKIDKHAHVLVKGNQVYSLNMSGRGHDGYHGERIHNKVADYLRTKGFNIPKSNIIESVDWTPGKKAPCVEVRFSGLLW